MLKIISKETQKIYLQFTKFISNLEKKIPPKIKFKRKGETRM